MRMLITPEMAADMLLRNYPGNRRVRTIKVNNLAQAMRDGRFVCTPQNRLILTTDGVLIDGQHRLNAIIQSGCSAEMHVDYVPPEDAKLIFDNIDQGTIRRPGDKIGDMNAVVSRVMNSLECGTAPIRSVLGGFTHPNVRATNSAVIDFYDEHDALVESVKSDVGRMTGSIGGSPMVFTAFIDLIRLVGDNSRIGDFVDDWSGLSSTSVPIQVAKNKILKAKAQRAPMSKPAVLGMVLDSYRAFLAGSTSTRCLGKSERRIDEYDALLNEWRASNFRGSAISGQQMTLSAATQNGTGQLFQTDPEEE